MDGLTAARAQMEVSLGFHMVFAALGIGMPLLMVIAEGLWLRTGKPHYRELALKWSKATALTFAVGAVSGTALSFELGLLWPRFMRFAGGIIGPAFALEGYAFFIEAIFIGLYLYGWDRLSPRAHWLAGIPVALSGMLSGILVVAANAWMQQPVGFRMESGRAVDVAATAVFQSPVWATMSLHSTLSCYIATAFAAAGVYALAMLRGESDDYHRSALRITMAVAALSAVMQLPSGHASAQEIGKREPIKLAAAEAHFDTGRHVALLVGGLPRPETGTVDYALRIPSGLSLMTTNDPNGEIVGLNSVPPDERPNVFVMHAAFDIMVGCGFAMIAVGVWFWLWQWRRRRQTSRLLLWAIGLVSPLGMLALEAGWIVSEVGRQPWVIYRVMRTRDAVTPSSEVQLSFVSFTLLYLGLAVVMIVLLRSLAKVRTTTPPPAPSSPLAAGPG